MIGPAVPDWAEVVVQIDPLLRDPLELGGSRLVDGSKLRHFSGRSDSRIA